jgi:hypothetical protein
MMQIVSAQRHGARYVFKVHLDTTKAEPDGTPWPNWTRTYTYPADGSLTVAQIKADMRAKAQADLAAIGPTPAETGDAGATL